MTDEAGYRGWFDAIAGGTRRIPEIELPASRSGVDEVSAVFWAVIFAIGTSISLGLAIYEGSSVWLSAALGSWVMCVIAATCSRWRVRVTTDGVEYRRWECAIPVERKTFMLDVEVSLYESWEAVNGPEGLEIRDPRGEWDDTTGCFGPYFSEAAQVEVLLWLGAALDAARSEVGARRKGFGCPELAGDVDRIRVTKWGMHGEPREAVVTDSLSLSGIPVAEGSTLLFNDDRSIRDPRREDTLRGVRLSEGSVLPNGFELRRGALVSFVGDRVWVHENGPGRVVCDGAALYVEDVMFDADWQPTRFTLAESLVVDGFEIPAESDVSRMRALSPHSFWFYVTLSEPVMHEGGRYERSQSVFFDSGKRLLRPHSPCLVDATFDAELQAARSVEDGKKEVGEI